MSRSSAPCIRKNDSFGCSSPVRRATSTSAMPKLTACAAVVASAAPAVPMPSPATNHRSSTVFTTVATPMMSSGVRESPTPRSTAESAL